MQGGGAGSRSFGDETRTWLLANAPPAMRTPLAPGEEACWGGKREKRSPDVQRWLDVNVERGSPLRPGRASTEAAAFSKAEAKVLSEEMNALGLRPPLIGFGLSMIGPLLLQEGSEALRGASAADRARRDPVVSGILGAGGGSDLASLQTKAVRDGDAYVLDGSKIWTSYAEKADWMFILVRTDRAAKKQHGITFLLMDMTTPGVTVRPIRLISGASPFCETFLTGVRVPVTNVVGQENQGWALARALLAHERTMIGDAFKERGDTDKLVAAARDHLGDDGGRIADPLIRDRIAALEIDIRRASISRCNARRTAPGQGRSRGTSRRLSQARRYGAEPAASRPPLRNPRPAGARLGERALGRRDRRLCARGAEGDPATGSARAATRIEGGTSEIQLDIIAKRVLGLPDARDARKDGA